MRIYYGEIVYRMVEVAHMECLIKLIQACDAGNIPLIRGIVKGDALVSRSRSRVASSFLRSDADVLLCIDSDIWFRPEDAIELCRKAEEYDIIGGLYMTRSLQTQPAIMLPDNEPVVFHAGAKPVEAQFISTGFTAVHRRVFERLEGDMPLCHQNWRDNGVDLSFWPFYMPYTIPWEGDGHMYLSEDWAFCQRAKDAGFKVWLDPSIRLGHMGDVMYTLEDLIRESKPAPAPMVLSRDENGKLAATLVPAEQITQGGE